MELFLIFIGAMLGVIFIAIKMIVYYCRRLAPTGKGIKYFLIALGVALAFINLKNILATVIDLSHISFPAIYDTVGELMLYISIWVGVLIFFTLLFSAIYTFVINHEKFYKNLLSGLMCAVILVSAVFCVGNVYTANNAVQSTNWVTCYKNDLVKKDNYYVVERGAYSIAYSTVNKDGTVQEHLDTFKSVAFNYKSKETPHLECYVSDLDFVHKLFFTDTRNAKFVLVVPENQIHKIES